MNTFNISCFYSQSTWSLLITVIRIERLRLLGIPLLLTYLWTKSHHIHTLSSHVPISWIWTHVHLRPLSVKTSYLHQLSLDFIKSTRPQYALYYKLSLNLKQSNCSHPRPNQHNMALIHKERWGLQWGPTTTLHLMQLCAGAGPASIFYVWIAQWRAVSHQKI